MAEAESPIAGARLAAPPQPAGVAAAGGAAERSYYQAIFFTYVALSLLIFTYLIPPFQKNDEPSHYWRAVTIANGDFFCGKDENGRYYATIERKYEELPQVLGAYAIYTSLSAKFSPDRLRADFSDPRYSDPKEVRGVCNLAIPGYIPNTLGVLAGKPFQSPVIGFYLGRIGGVLFFVLCMVWSLRVVPERYKLLVYFYLALPMVLHQVSSISYDAVQLSLFPVLFAYLTRFMVQEGRVARRDLLIFMAVIWLILSIKPVGYYGVLLIYLAIPRSKVSDTLWGYLRATVAFVAVTAVSIGAFEVLYVQRSGLVNPEGGAIDPSAQIRFTLEHPLNFLLACYRTLSVQGEVLLRQAIGVFGWVGFEINAAVFYVAVFLAVLMCYHLTRRDEVVLGPGENLALWSSLAVTVAALFFSLYVIWSPVGGDTVAGLQGRYFLGLIPFGMLAISQTVGGAAKDMILRLAATALGCFLVFSIFRAIMDRYY